MKRRFNNRWFRSSGRTVRGTRPGRSRRLRVETLEGRQMLSVGGGPPPGQTIELAPLGTYATGIFDDSAAEIVAYDPAGQQLFVTNSADEAVDVLDIHDPSSPTKTGTLAVSGSPTSVAVHGDLVAVAVPNATETKKGHVEFFNTGGDFLGRVEVGRLPDMVTFTPDGSKVLTADEGQPNVEYSVDPVGSVSIIDVATMTVKTASFAKFNSQRDELRASGVRIFGPNATVAQDLEPEYVAVSADSSTAWVALQEANAIAILDIASGEFTSIEALGFKDHSLQQNALDASNKDDAINITTWPVKGMYQPDAIKAYTAGDGNTYLLSANEGDSRDYDGFSEEARVKDLVLDPVAFPDADALQKSKRLGRLKVTTALGDTDGDGDFDELYAYGARSFSIWDAQGNLVFDSGDQIEQITAALLPDDFNSTNDKNDSFDNRSDDKGPEPEGVVVGQVGNKTFAFIGLERLGGIMVYDVTDPVAPVFHSYFNNRDFSGDAEAGTAGDLAPEGLAFISAEDSPTGTPLLVVANEVSGTTTVFEVGRNLVKPNGSAEMDWLGQLDQASTKQDSPVQGDSAAVDLLMTMN